MAKYTIELYKLIEMKVDIGLNEYPIFSELYRETLNKKIIDRYYAREICCETPALFRLYMSRTMNEIMPKYNQLYESANIKFDPFNNYDFMERITGGTTSIDSSKLNSNSDDKTMQSDTPMGTLNNAWSDDYATVTGKSEGKGEQTSSNNNNTTQDITRRLTGKNSMESYSELLEKYRKTFLNIDLDIIRDLEDCFYCRW